MIDARIEIISPAEAKNILRKTEDLGFFNRQERHHAIKRYAADMQNGRWKTTGETIKITRDGKLIDGFHRLRAVISANIPCEFLVARNVTEDAFEVIDTGQKRTLSDVMYIKGFKKYTKYTTAASKALAYFIKNKQYPPHGAGVKYDQDTIENILLKHYPVMSEAAQFYAKKTMSLVNSSVLISTWTMFSTIDSEKTRAFFELVSTGANLTDFHPCLLLRNALYVKSKGKHVLKTNHEAALVILAWNNFYKGKEMKLLRYSTSTAYPLIEGFDLDNFI